jgi:putative ABC transport system permease protein
MLRNCIAVAFRNISRNPLYAGVSLFGLAVGVCAALLAATVIHSEYHYDVFIPGYQRTYLIVGITNLTPGNRLFHGDETNARLAKLLQLQVPQIEAVARIAKPETATQEVFLRHGDVEASEPIYWADPSIFRVLPFPVAAGDLTAALERPDAIVLTRSLARKYFGREDVLGETILLDRKETLVVTAVIEDLPASRFSAHAFLSGRASFSPLSSMDRSPFNANPDIYPFPQVNTYVRLRPGASLSQIQQTLPHVAQQMWPNKPPGTIPGRHLRKS